MPGCQRTITPQQAVVCMTYAGISASEQQEVSFIGTNGGGSVCGVPAGAELYRIIPFDWPATPTSWVLMGWAMRELVVPDEAV